MIRRRRETFAACGGLFLALAGDPLAAQAPVPTDSVRRCDSTVRAAAAEGGLVTVRAFLQRVDGDAVAAPFAGLLVQELSARLALPKPLALPVFAAGAARLRALRPTRDTAVSFRTPVISAAFLLTVRGDGGIDSVLVGLPSTIPGFDSSIVEALRRTGAEHAAPPLDSAGVADARFLLRVSSLEERGEPVPLFQARFPRVPVDDATPLPDSPSPPYPERERAAGVEGSVLLRFVVDAQGLPELETAEVLRATTRGFADAALRALPRVRFAPARVGACGVPQLVQLPFTFLLPPEG